VPRPRFFESNEKWLSRRYGVDSRHWAGKAPSGRRSWLFCYFNKCVRQDINSEELTHLWRGTCRGGVSRHLEAVQNQPQSALVLKQSGRSKTLLRLRADDDDSYMSPAIG